jgi:hypothetical protein
MVFLSLKTLMVEKLWSHVIAPSTREREEAVNQSVLMRSVPNGKA